MTKRLLPEFVEHCYEMTGLKPKQGSLFGDGGTACGMGAARTLDEKIYAGLSAIYQNGFAHGFDNLPYYTGYNDVAWMQKEYDLGYTDGKASWELMNQKEKECGRVKSKSTNPVISVTKENVEGELVST